MRLTLGHAQDQLRGLACGKPTCAATEPALDGSPSFVEPTGLSSAPGCPGRPIAGGSEDCLILNVSTPPRANLFSLLPVVVNLHSRTVAKKIRVKKETLRALSTKSLGAVAAGGGTAACDGIQLNHNLRLRRVVTFGVRWNHNQGLRRLNAPRTGKRN